MNLNLKQRIQKEMFETLLKAGYSVAEIAMFYGISRTSMYYKLKRLEINLTKNSTGV